MWHFRYNGFDQLTDVYTPGKEWWRYTYDALGRRSSKHRLTDEGGSVEHISYLWDGDHAIEETSVGGTFHWAYEPGSYVPLTQVVRSQVGNNFVAIITDLAGMPTELIDPLSPVIASTGITTLWGKTTWSFAAPTALRFPGQHHDPETGLHYNHHRYYDPETARYLTQDPLGLAPAPNPNSYPANPLAWSDPLGLTPCPNSGKRPAKGGLTHAGREYQKHMGRGDLPTVPGKELDSAGQGLLERIFNDPNARIVPVTGGNFPGGTRYIVKDPAGGRDLGITFDANGNFQYFGRY
nr:RHS repeat-associated core domain-containing protein [Nocardia sp. MDA0666]